MDITSALDIFCIEFIHLILCTHSVHCTQYSGHTQYMETHPMHDMPNTSHILVMHMFVPMSTGSLVCKHVIFIMSTHWCPSTSPSGSKLD